MKKTININDKLLARAQKIAGDTSASKIVEMALQALIERRSALYLAQMGGSQPNLRQVVRRRPNVNSR
ncbi:MAG: type II toxin-antitoxin system VapB family antitoxin [Gammaproteobacteria bacterium]